MVDYLSGPVAHEAFFKKYASKKFLKGLLMTLYVFKNNALIILASILTRQWAKKYHSLYLDSGSHPTTTKGLGSVNLHNNRG